MRVCVVGGTTVDVLLVGVPCLPQADSAADEFTQQSLVSLPAAPALTIGGNAGNAAFALATLGCAVSLVTALGDEVLGRQAHGWLAGAGCHVMPVPPQQTSVNVVATDRRGRRISFFYPVSPEPAPEPPEGALTAGEGDHLLLAGFPHPDDAVIAGWASAARRQGATVWLDIGPAPAGFTTRRLDPLLPLLDFLICNREELAALDAGADPADTARRVASAVRGGLVVKAGADGAELHTPAGVVHVPAFPVPATATVGAGDVFNAGLIHAAGQADSSPRRRLRYACAAAAVMLTRGRGALASPTHDDVAAFLTEHGGDAP